MARQSPSSSYPRRDNLNPLFPAAAPWQAPLLHPATARIGWTWLRKLGVKGLSKSRTVTFTAASRPAAFAVNIARPVLARAAGPVSVFTTFRASDGKGAPAGDLPARC